MKKTITILTAVLSLAVAQAQIETNNLFYHAFRTPQTNQLNPALFPNTTFYLQLPSSNLLLGFPLSVSDVVHYDAKQKANVINLNTIIDNLGADNPFRLGWDFNLVGFGLKVGNVFVDVNTQLRTSMSVGVAGGIINGLLNGNMDENGDVISPVTIAGGNLFNMQAYLESSVGAGYRIDPINLTVGVHAKLLSGIMNIHTDNTSVTIETAKNFDTVAARIYYEAVASSSLPIDTTGGMSNMLNNMTKDMSQIVTNMLHPSKGNTGVAFDIGAKYTLGPLAISASINDLTAGIHWQNNVMSIVPENEGVVTFGGVDINNLLNGGQMSFDTLNTMLEELKSLKPRFDMKAQDYWYTIPTKVNLAASVDLLRFARLGLLLHGQFDRGLLSRSNSGVDMNKDIMNTFRFNTTATIGINVFNWMEIIAGSSLVFDGNKPDFLNPGAGFILSLGTVLQSYFMVDYMSSLYLVDSKAFNMKFGMNLMFGKGTKKRYFDN